MTLGQAITAGPFNLPVVRLLILAGAARVILRGERLPGGWNRLDTSVLAFTTIALLSALTRPDPWSHFVGNAGLAFNVAGTYALMRVWCAGRDEALVLFKVLAIVLVPVAIEMAYEVSRGHNLFSVLGGVPEAPAVREGRTRAQGPFAHAILAGTVGAVCVPMFVGLWSRSRYYALAGMAASLVMVAASASSGPLGSLAFGAAALAMWRYRYSMRHVRHMAVALYLVLEVVMKAPPYFLMARIDLVGGSTGYHRAELIRSALEHIDEWWLNGTDHTRHWMVTGVSWSTDHTDITNQYLQLGVVGGLPLMLAFIWILVRAFSMVGITIHREETATPDQYEAWCLGAALFAQAATCLSVAYFDQSFVFLYLNIALVAASDVTAPPLPAHTAKTLRRRRTVRDWALQSQASVAWSAHK